MKKNLLLLLLSVGLLSNCRYRERQETTVTETDTTEKVVHQKKVHKAESNTLDEMPIDSTPIRLVRHAVHLAKGDTFTLSVPAGFSINVAAEGFQRPRFMTFSPDGRLFVTDLINLNDNEHGRIIVLEEQDSLTHRFTKSHLYLAGLRNPNSVAFYTDKQNKTWIYIALTGEIIRYPYSAGDTVPQGKPQRLVTLPDFGRSYKEGGWHLTRTLAIHNDKVYFSVGSSCDACIEKEDLRAGIWRMDPDGKNLQVYARGLRNAVGMKWVNDQLFVTGMGSDHFGPYQPDETLYATKEGTHYGWPYYYQDRGEVKADSLFANDSGKPEMHTVPSSYAFFPPHSAPLGLEYFSDQQSPAEIRNYFLVGLHGSSVVKLRRGYEIVRVKNGIAPEPVVSGFLQGTKRTGRPCDVLAADKNSFYFTDDYNGVVYWVGKK